MKQINQVMPVEYKGCHIFVLSKNPGYSFIVNKAGRVNPVFDDEIYTKPADAITAAKSFIDRGEYE